MKLGATLAEWRKRAGKRVEDAALRLDCTKQKIGHIEAARNKIRVSELRDLCAFYGVPDDVAAEMEQMRVAAAQPRWWATHRLPRWLDNYVGLEDAAWSCRTVQLELVPGLLQIPEYVTALQAVRNLPVDQASVERAAAARIERQKRLTAATDPLKLEVVVSEAALRRALGSPEAGMKQLKHLIDMAGRKNIDVRIIPFDRGLHASMSGSFTLLAFDASPEVGYQEYPLGGHIVDDREAVERMHKIWVELRAQALDEAESMRFLAELTGDTAHDGSVDVEKV
jgi:transcriptional regulator with XRE-family HTH domain